MAGESDLKEVYNNLDIKFKSEIDVDDALVSSILSYRLLIERIGEEKNNNWKPRTRRIGKTS